MILGPISDSLYFSRPEISNSDCKLIEKSISHYLNKDQKEDTSSMGFGRALHSYVLEESNFHQNYIVSPEGMDRRTKIGKDQYQHLLDSGREVISASDWREINQLRDNLRAHPMAKNVLNGAQCEGVLTGEFDGVPVRAKIDLLNNGYVIDLKSCQDASASEFARSIGKYNYYQQAAFYIDLCAQNGLGATGFLFIAVERGARQHGVACYSLDQPSIDIGRASYKKSLAKYKDYLNNPKQYVGYSDKIENIGAPHWCFHKEQGVL